MREVEAKAHVPLDRLKEVQDYFDLQYCNLKKVSKSDKYYLDANKKEFRIRESNGKIIYCKKDRETTKNGFEQNSEDEKEVTSSFATDLTKGLKPFFTKEKQGFVWNTKFNGSQSNIELLQVTGLGWFLEIEVLLDENCINNLDSACKDAQNWIYDFFKKLNLTSQIEGRKYMEMLQNGR